MIEITEEAMIECQCGKNYETTLMQTTVSVDSMSNEANPVTTFREAALMPCPRCDHRYEKEAVLNTSYWQKT